jgi:MerR family transcriptional regulator, light-induced transcriptional regulator
LSNVCIIALVDASDDLGPYLRIGELASRAGISTDLLRAWERRYGLLDPTRTPAGYRLYSRADEERVRRMVAMVESGVSPRQAARATLASVSAPAPLSAAPAGERAALRASLDELDETAAQAAFDRMLSAYSLRTVVSGIVFPYLQELGDRWAAGTATVAQEHFASNLIRARLLGLARGWGGGAGPHAVLSCPSGEAHDIGLIAFGLAMRGQGWRITFLGADTPSASIAEVAAHEQPGALVVAATSPDPFRRLEPLALGLSGRWAIGGAGASADTAERLDALLLDDDPFQAAERLTAVRGHVR